VATDTGFYAQGGNAGQTAFSLVIADRGDDFQVAATVCAVLDIDIEHALEQAGPTPARWC
jgi:hypothetical protein